MSLIISHLDMLLKTCTEVGNACRANVTCTYTYDRYVRIGMRNEKKYVTNSVLLFDVTCMYHMHDDMLVTHM